MERDGAAAANRAFYDALWRRSKLAGPECFNTWPVVQTLLRDGGRRLELGPGLHPRLPIAGTAFVDVSAEALARLRDKGGCVAVAPAGAMPFPDAAFDLLCAFDIVEHVADDAACFAELARVARPGGALLLSVPLHPARWSRFDEIVGHCRRYDPVALGETLRRHGFEIERSAGFGMRPRASWLASVGMEMLARHPAEGFWCYNNILLPLAIRRQKPLALEDGMVTADQADGVLLVCRKAGVRSTGS